MTVPKCEFCLTQEMLPARKLEPGCVFCMTLWREVRQEESCWDCASNEEASNWDDMAELPTLRETNANAMKEPINFGRSLRVLVEEAVDIIHSNIRQ